MLHILLGMLKIIAIILLVLLGIVLFLALSILFVPVRYRLQGDKSAEDYNVQTKVKWFLGVVSFSFRLAQNESFHSFRIFGVNIGKVLNKKKQKTAKKRVTKKTNAEKDVDKKVVAEKSVSEVNAKLTDLEKNTDVKKPKSSDKLDKSEKREDNKEKKFKLTIRTVCDRINQWKDISSDDNIKAAALLLKAQLFKLLKHIFPKKIQGRVCFGFEDPCTTGQILGAVSVFYPLYYKSFCLNPDFTQEVLDGNIKMKGRVYGFFLLKVIWIIYFDKNIQNLIQVYRNKEAS